MKKFQKRNFIYRLWKEFCLATDREKQRRRWTEQEQEEMGSRRDNRGLQGRDSTTICRRRKESNSVWETSSSIPFSSERWINRLSFSTNNSSIYNSQIDHWICLGELVFRLEHDSGLLHRHSHRTRIHSRSSCRFQGRTLFPTTYFDSKTPYMFWQICTIHTKKEVSYFQILKLVEKTPTAIILISRAPCSCYLFLFSTPFLR